ncbi:Uncharacterised protein [Bordetella pertussis]|nr:Uncharacterised protein [Bordetella pertussis]
MPALSTVVVGAWPRSGSYSPVTNWRTETGPPNSSSSSCAVAAMSA